MRAVVFGAMGMVGRAVVTQLEQTHQFAVVKVDRRSGGPDVEQSVDVRPWLDGGDVIVNCIGLLRSDPRYPGHEFMAAARAINSGWPGVLAGGAAKSAARVIHLSTDAVYSPSHDPAFEVDPPDAVEPYGVSKAGGEICSENVINLRFSVIGPAPDRPRSMWEWVVGQPHGATIQGYSATAWTGCTSLQLGQLIAALADPETFDNVRATGSIHHFTPNGTATKYEIIRQISAHVRPDLIVRPVVEPSLTGRPLGCALRSLECIYRGARGGVRP